MWKPCWKCLCPGCISCRITPPNSARPGTPGLRWYCPAYHTGSRRTNSLSSSARTSATTSSSSRRKKPPKLGSLKLHRSGSTPLRLLTPEPPAKADGGRQKAEECPAKPWEGRREGILGNSPSHLNTGPNCGVQSRQGRGGETVRLPKPPGVYKGCTRDVQGIPKGTTPSQHRRYTAVDPGLPGTRPGPKAAQGFPSACNELRLGPVCRA